MYIIHIPAPNSHEAAALCQAFRPDHNLSLIFYPGLSPLDFTLSCTFLRSRSLLDSLQASSFQSNRCDTRDGSC